MWCARTVPVKKKAKTMSIKVTRKIKKTWVQLWICIAFWTRWSFRFTAMKSAPRMVIWIFVLWIYLSFSSINYNRRWALIQVYISWCISDSRHVQSKVLCAARAVATRQGGSNWCAEERARVGLLLVSNSMTQIFRCQSDPSKLKFHDWNPHRW